MHHQRIGSACLKNQGSDQRSRGACRGEPLRRRVWTELPAGREKGREWQRNGRCPREIHCGGRCDLRTMPHSTGRGQRSRSLPRARGCCSLVKASGTHGRLAAASASTRRNAAGHGRGNGEALDYGDLARWQVLAASDAAIPHEPAGCGSRSGVPEVLTARVALRCHEITVLQSVRYGLHSDVKDYASKDAARSGLSLAEQSAAFASRCHSTAASLLILK